MAKFVTDEELDNSISDIVFNAEKVLLILSPFIKLDNYFRVIFDKQSSNSELKIVIGFGKNEGNINKSFNREDFEYFKKFPNISIVYVPNLHAKYYANEKKGIITSINLYDYSFKNNIEYGVLFESGLFNVQQVDQQAWEFTNKLLDKNYAVFIRKPRFKKKLLGKDYLGSDTILDYTEDLLRNRDLVQKSFLDFESADSIIEVFKVDKKPTRQEVELDGNKKYNIGNSASKSQNDKGYCIKCKTEIPLNSSYPYCRSCFRGLSRNHSDYDREYFCHRCGKPSKVSQKMPLCDECYK
jgi:hypothetical protein